MHYIISRIINRYLGELNDDIEYEKELRNLLDSLRDEIWESCGDSTGLCSKQVVREIVNRSLKSGFEIIITKYSTIEEAKSRIIDIVRKIVEGINEYTKTAIGEELIDSSWITTPSTYKVKIVIKRDIDPEARLEIINEAGIKIVLEPKHREVKTELTKGSYVARLVSRGIVYAQKRFDIDRNTEIEITPREHRPPQNNMAKLKRRTRRLKAPAVGYSLATIALGFRDPTTRIIYISIILLIASITLQIIASIR